MISSIWTEKYRPKDFSEIAGQEKIVERIKAFVDQKNMPHLLFAGPAGIGKTTLSLVIARNLFGESWNHNFLELNASDDRGIDTVRVKVKDFARTRAIGDVPFKIIYLDECDSLTKEAQQALRRTMESFTATCRFILSCNYSSKIIEPIQSRCTIFRFKPLDKHAILKIINNIAKTESIEITEDAKNNLIEISGGDARRLENILQSCAAIHKVINDQAIYDIVSVARPKEIREVLQKAISNDFIGARNLLLDIMLNHGLSGVDVIKQIQQEILNLEIPNEHKMRLIDKCGDIEFRLVEGSDEFLQLESLLANFTQKHV